MTCTQHDLADSQWVRVTAAELEPGDCFAEARTHDPVRLEAIESVGPSSRWLRIDGTVGISRGRIRPRHTKRFWKLVCA